ncbi:MAG: type II secretion system protein GspM [Bryobacteraceae bacterium]|nr:type II secretion system protein GspM [Bryobacteraceae bacterium]
MKQLSERERRALILLIPVSLMIIAYWLVNREKTSEVGAEAVTSIPAAERRLQRVQQLSSTVPGKEQVLLQVRAELASRERNLIQADTAAQAQAQLLQIIRKLAKSPATNIDLRNTEIGQVKPYGTDYGEVAVAVNFEAGIEQLVNFLSDLTAQKEMIGTTDLRIGAANPKQKTMPVRVTISALVRKELIPDKKGSAF